MVAKPLNPAELKLDLLCSGLRVGEESHATEGARPLASSRAGLGSGLELVIPGHRRDVWVNAPVVEKFVQRTPYRLQCGGTSHFIVDGRTGFSYPVRLAPRPSWYDQSTSSGLSMFRVAVLHGTCLFINVGERCRFWGADEAMACRFCSTGLDPGWDDGTKIGVEDVVQTALRARSESNVTFVMLHAGYQGPGALEQAFSFVKALKERVGVLVGLQFVPEEDLALYDRVIALGVDHLSFSFEFYNPDYFRRYLPGKDSMVGRRQFFRALEHCARRLPKGRVSAEMIAGIEPLRDTLSAVDYIGCIGA
ncbi:MAG: hypothetical protein FJW35_17690, partial [Acidobacteria bacterium]|nr:hypothetical protein [Acidobacteriota bacterium]